MSYTVVSFYKFVELAEPPALKAAVRDAAGAAGLLGTVLLATEGINGSLSGTAAGVEAFVEALRRMPPFADMPVKLSVGRTPPFRQLVVKVKRWIIRFAEAADPSVAETRAGRRLSPADLRRLLHERPDDVVVLDARNDYEHSYGTFVGAETLPMRRFTEFPELFMAKYAGQEDKTFVFFCTGGVRCEKVVPWAERRGFRNVFQLDGGILAYFEQEGGAGYAGDCFVFDERWLLAPELTERQGRATPGHFPKRRQSGA